VSANLPPVPREALAALLGAEDDVEVAALFGSAATGAMTARSDVDVYLRLVPGAKWSLARELSLASDVSELVGREIDLVVEDPAHTSVLLRREVARTGELLFEREPGAWTTLKAEAIIAYVDLAPHLTRCAEGVSRALAQTHD